MKNAKYAHRSGEPSTPIIEAPVGLMSRMSERPLRVLHVLHSISPKNGGPVQSLWFLLKASAMSGIRAAVVTTNEDGPNRRADVPFDRFVDVRGFQVRYFRCQTNFYAASAPMLRWLWAHVRDYDVVHIHALFSFSPVAAAYCARLRGIPYVVSPHGVLNSWGRENRRPLLKRGSIGVVESPLLRRAANVQFTSGRELQEFGQLGIEVKSVVIPLPMPAEDENSADANFRPAPELMTLEGRPAILFLARIHPIKGLDLLLQAFAGIVRRHPMVVLLIAGDGETRLVAELHRLAADLGVERQVLWTGFAEGSLKRWLLERADIFVLPSWSENYGLAVAEAMAAGVPVVVTQGVGIADIVAESGCGLVTECSVPALQQAIETLLDDTVARTRMGRAGRDAVREQLSIESYCGRLTRMYQTAAGSLPIGE